MRLLALACAVLLTACTPPAEPVQAPVLISVFHERGGEEVETIGLFDRFGLSGRATGFSAADFARLPASEIETAYPLGGEAASWTGPRLSAVLAAISAPGAGARLTAVDGYQVEVTAEEIDRFEPILATRRDGAPLAFGGLGPVILIWPRDVDPELADMNDDQWPWAVFAVEVLEPVDG